MKILVDKETLKAAIEASETGHLVFSTLHTNGTIPSIGRLKGFIEDFKVSKDNVGGTIVLTLKYGPNKERVITGLKRISKPGLRVYAKNEDIPKVLNGLGIAIISTSRGLMTDKEARNESLGGEVLAYIW